MAIFLEQEESYDQNVKKAVEFFKRKGESLRVYTINETLISVPEGLEISSDKYPVKTRPGKGRAVVVTPNTLFVASVNNDSGLFEYWKSLLGRLGVDFSMGVSNYQNTASCSSVIYPGEFCVGDRKLVSVIKRAPNALQSYMHVTSEYREAAESLGQKDLGISLEEVIGYPMSVEEVSDLFTNLDLGE